MKESLILAQHLDSKYEIAAGFYRWGQAAQYLGSPARTVALSWAAKPRLMPLVWAYRPKSWMQNLKLYLIERFREPGEAAVAEAVGRGRAITMEQAIVYALENSP